MKLIIAVLTVLLSLTQLPAQAAEAGRDYIVLSYPQPVSVKRGQVEVLEFFWYRCDHCFKLEPALVNWLKKQPKDVVFKRVPAVLSPGWLPMARAYYALEALGLVDKLHHEVFDAIHVRGMDLTAPEAFFDWAVTKGVDRRKIADAYHGFSVDTQVKRAQQFTLRYGVNAVPALVVNGRYLTSAGIAGSESALFKTIDALIAMERKQGKARN